MSRPGKRAYDVGLEWLASVGWPHWKPMFFGVVSPDLITTDTVCFWPGFSPFSKVRVCEPGLSGTLLQGVTGQMTFVPSVTFAHG